MILSQWHVIHSLATIVTITLVTCHSCPPCKQKKCPPLYNCTAGEVWDACKCCHVCARVEGQLCGGLGFRKGQCASGLSCVARDIRSYRNKRMNDTNELMGRCEPELCGPIRCKFGQYCSLFNGLPRCICPTKCQGTITTPVCGETNRRLYPSECDLKIDECRIGKRIGLSNEPCLDRNTVKVHCTAQAMSLVIARQYLRLINVHDLTLYDEHCLASMNETHVVFKTSLRKCKTRKWFTLTSVIYSNVVRNSYKNYTSNITRKRRVHIPFECEYRLRQRNRNRVTFEPIENGVTGNKRNNGIRSRAKSNSNDPERNARSPVDFKVRITPSRTFVVKLTSKKYRSSKYKILPRRCQAVPIPKEHRSQMRILLDKGCPVEEGVRILPSDDLSVKLLVPRVEFIGCRVPGFTVRCKLKACYKSRTSTNSWRNVCKPVMPSCSNRIRRDLTWEDDTNMDDDAEVIISSHY